MLSQSSRPYLDKTRLSCLASLVLAVKTIRQKHQVSPELLRLLDEFRRMVNVCIAVEIEENVSSLKTLSLRSYHRLSSDILGYYRLGAISVATGDTSRLSKGQEEETADKVSICEKND